MDANVLEQAEVWAKSIAGQATTMEEFNGVMKTLMKSALEQMLGAELFCNRSGTAYSVRSNCRRMPYGGF